MSGSLLLEWALAYAARGWPVLPLHSPTSSGCSCGAPDCSSPAKHPRTRNGLKDATTDEAPIQSWWGRWPNANIGLRTGESFDVLDVDGDAGFDAITAIEAEEGVAPPGPTSFTGGGGLHRLYLPTGAGNKAGLLEHVDWRGRNGYIVAPPSCHASGNFYEWHPEFDINTPLVEADGWLRALLFPPVRKTAGSSTHPAGGPHKASGYARRAFDAELAELARACQGTRNNTLNNCAFNLYQLVHGGELDDHEVTAAVTHVALGIGLTEREISATLNSAREGAAKNPRSAPALFVATQVGRTGSSPPDGPGPAAAPAAGITDDEDDLTGWEAADIAGLIASGCHISPPVLYSRSDEVKLLYAAKIHAFNGEPESGKSWAAQHATVQALEEGHQVCYIDFEDSAESVISRLVALGAKPDGLAEQLTYISPDRPLTGQATDVLRARFKDHKPDLVVIDGMTEAMSILGLDPQDNADSARFFQLLPRRLARLGAAVIIVDHVAKDREQRGRWAIGAQHKMAALTGAAFTVDTVQAFGRNTAGFAKITVTKDRPGYIRQHASGSVVGELHLVSKDDSVHAELRPPPVGEDGQHRPTVVMERISKVLEGGPAVNSGELKAAVGGRNEVFLQARRLLRTEDYIRSHKNGNTEWWTSYRSYRAANDPRLHPESEDTKDDDGPF